MKLVSLLGFCIMEINTQLSTTGIHTESIQTHHSKLRLISRIEFDYSPTPRSIHFKNRVDTLVVLRQFFQHEPAEIDWQILDLDQVCWECFCRSRWSASPFLGHNYLRLLLNIFFFDLGNLLLLFFQLLFLCCGSVLQSSYLCICFFESLALTLVLTFFLLQKLSFFLKELLAAYLFLSIIFLLTLPPSIIYHFLQADTLI